MVGWDNAVMVIFWGLKRLLCPNFCNFIETCTLDFTNSGNYFVKWVKRFTKPEEWVSVFNLNETAAADRTDRTDGTDLN